MATSAIPPTIYPTAFFSNIRSITTSVISNDFDYIDMNGGSIQNVAYPVNAYDAVNKQYVSDIIGDYDLTGPISSNNGVTSITSQTGSGSTFVMNNSPTIINGLSMNSSIISNLAEPIFSTDAATKNYVDTHGGGGGGNLTGPITSVGLATSIASQTGTGTKFVVDTSPTLITPNIGVASATSLTSSGKIQVNDLTNATSMTTGSINSLGGISCHKDIYAGGTCYALDFLATSDRRLKSNIKNIDNKDIFKFLKVQGYTYNFKDDPKTRYGIMAQDLEELGLDSLVDNSEFHKKVSYQSLIPIMIETIKALEQKIEESNMKFALIERRFEKLEHRIRKSDTSRKKRLSKKIK